MLVDLFHDETVAEISSSTTAELGGGIWALIFILHDQDAERQVMHCDSEVAISCLQNNKVSTRTNKNIYDTSDHMFYLSC